MIRTTGGPAIGPGVSVRTRISIGPTLLALAACIDEVLAVPVIDAFGTKPENTAHFGMDTINGPDDIVPRV